MPDPTHPPIALRSDTGESVEIDGDQVVLRLAPWRADDLVHVLTTYTRLIALVDRASEVSGTETDLATALRDAGTYARLTAERSADERVG
jgi:hypothetical protein